jgi:hypothetical protein
MTDQDKEILETELFNRVLLNRIENKRDEIKRLKSTNYQLKTQLKKQSGSQLIKEIFAFVGMVSIAIFTIFALYKAFL